MDNYSSFLAADHTKSTKPSKTFEGSLGFDEFQPRIMFPQVRCEQDAKPRNVAAIDHQQEEYSGREKLFRHWNEVGGRVCVPEKWGQEDFLKDWTDCSLFDVLLAPKGAVSAREALIAERKRESTTRHHHDLMKVESMY